MSTELSSSETVTVVDTGEREAFIFIPGIGRTWDDPTIEGVARRMATAIDRESKTEKAKAHVEIAQQEYGAGYKCKMFTIVKREGQTERPLIDVFGLEYNDTLVESYANRSLFMKIVLLAITMVDTFGRLIFRFYKKGKSWKEKAQLLYGFLIASLLIAYFVILIAAVVASFEQLNNVRKERQAKVPATPTVTSVPRPEQNVLLAQQSQLDSVGKLWSGIKKLTVAVWNGIKNLYQGVKDVLPPLIVLMTALGFVLPSQAKLKENISLAATNYLCLIHYLNWGESSHAIGGKLESLLEFIVEREPGYRKIHIVGYSFGSIVAIDNLFPVDRKPIDRFQRIDTLVTIGCPFDMIRTYWPSYFDERQSVAADAPKWINVYSPIDVLSSNFADGGNEQSEEQTKHEGIGLMIAGQIRKPENLKFAQRKNKSLGLLGFLTLAGFKAHSHYWGETAKGEVTCFHDVVKKMYHGTPVLN